MKKEKSNKANQKTPPYSMTEVGTLLESMDKQIKQIAEGHTGLDKKLDDVEVAIHGNSRRLDMVEVRIDVMSGRMTRLEDAVSKTSKDLKETRQSLETKIDWV